jgi:hypothetical protein
MVGDSDVYRLVLDSLASKSSVSMVIAGVAGVGIFVYVSNRTCVFKIDFLLGSLIFSRFGYIVISRGCCLHGRSLFVLTVF